MAITKSSKTITKKKSPSKAPQLSQFALAFPEHIEIAAINQHARAIRESGQNILRLVLSKNFYEKIYLNPSLANKLGVLQMNQSRAHEVQKPYVAHIYTSEGALLKVDPNSAIVKIELDNLKSKDRIFEKLLVKLDKFEMKFELISLPPALYHAILSSKLRTGGTFSNDLLGRTRNSIGFGDKRVTITYHDEP